MAASLADVLGGAPQSTAAFALKPGDWVLVADADNRTGEAIFDGTLRAAIERELEYSDYVRVVQRDRIGDALNLLQPPGQERGEELVAERLGACDRPGGAVPLPRDCRGRSRAPFH